MAAPSKSCIRVRLHFDFPPPSVVDCRMCWMLVDTASCRFIADLESVIRDKFEFSQGSILSLFIEDCYLPHTESILVVRDNDCVRVRLDTVHQVNGHSLLLESPAQHSRKRRRSTKPDAPVESSSKEDWKTKKRKKSVKESAVEVRVSVDDTKKSVVKDSGKKQRVENAQTAAPEPGVSPKAVPANGQQGVSLSKKKKKKNSKVPSDKAKAPKMPPLNSNSSSSSSSSSEEEVAPQKQASKAQKSAIPLISKKLLNSKPAMSKAPPPSEIDSSSREHLKASPHKKAKPIEGKADAQEERKTQGAWNGDPAPSDLQLTQPSGNEEEIELVIHRPVWPPNFSFGGHFSRQGETQGRGRGRDGGGDSGGSRGRQKNSNGYRDLSYQTDILSNTSVVIQNGAPTPKPDYSVMPLLAAPPPVGQKIAFKLLELTENYSPEVSDYKEGKVVSFDPLSQQIELELLNTSQAVTVEPGKFDLVYQNPDGSERVEYAVSRESWVTERWDSLLEPRLII
ncbi:coilin [Neosynchiropus ocellatus]